jgi:hypothetical protein
MRFATNTYKRIGCLLLLVMYISFLCFQVKHNLEIGKSLQRTCKLQITWQASSDNSSVASHAKHTCFSKVKTAPSKRFHPYFVVIDYINTSVPVVRYTKQRFTVEPAPFIAKPFHQISPLRGPPQA